MGGGASKSKQPPTPAKRDISETEKEVSARVPTIIGPKNGELAPIAAVPNFPKVSALPLQPIGTKYSSAVQPISAYNTKTESTPIVPISVIPTPLEPRTQPPASNNTKPRSPSPTPSVPPPPPPSTLPNPPSTTSPIPPDTNVPAPPNRSASPAPPIPLAQEVPDAFKTKPQFLDRKFSDGINSPITNYKKDREKEGKDKSTHNDDEDQVVVEDSDELEDEYNDPSTHTFHKSVADKFYQDVFAEKTKPKSAPKDNFTPAHRHPLLASQAAVTVSFQLESDDEEGLYTEYGDKYSGNLAASQKKLVSVPTLQLGGMGGQKKPGTAIVVSNKPPPEVAPVPRNHGNFDNDKFRAANAKKKNTDSIFKQSTYDYKAAVAISPTSFSSGASDRLSSPDDSSSFGYSSDTPMDSPDTMTRPPNTPTHKPAYDDFEETIISSILDD